MMSARLPSVKPMPAAAQPEYEFSIDTTTGMSAPPIGMMSVTPSTSATTVIAQNTMWFCVTKKMPIRTSMPTASAMLRRWRAGRMIGLPDIRAASFRNAMIEPVNVMAPMATPIDISIRLEPWISPGAPMPNASGA